jgi:hypothetical protein
MLQRKLPESHQIDEDINVENLLMGIGDRTHYYSHSECLAAYAAYYVKF